MSPAATDERAARGRLCVVGVGPGPGYLTPRGLELMRSCDHFVGGREALSAAPAWGRHLPVAGPLEPLFDEIESLLAEDAAVCVLTSGDPGYFSLLAALERRFPGRAVVEPGVASVQLLAARVGVPWQAVRHFSVHGRDLEIEPPADAPFAVLCSPENGPPEVATHLLGRGVRGTVAVGTSLGRADEAVEVLDLAEVPDRVVAGPAVLLVWPEGSAVPGPEPDLRSRWDAGPAPAVVPYGVGSMISSPSDDEFIREDRVPLSRWESRLLLAGIARPEIRRLIWEIGAGSGGFTVEMGLRAPLARIVAFERVEAACGVLARNLERFGVRAEIVERAAPQAFRTRPEDERPDLIVVGGSGGRLEDVLGEAAERLVPEGRVVCTAVTLETVAVATRVLAGGPWRRFEALQVTAARRAEHGILKGNNPVTFLWADRKED